jgi:sec-independent protein translocase protein TatC
MSLPEYPDEPGAEQPFISHLIELRDRLIRGLVAVLLVFLVLFPFSNSIYTYVAQPLMAQLPQGSTMIATEVATPFLAPFRLALVAAVFVAMPWLLYQMWAFVAPGLYRHEKRLAVPLLVSSIVLFYVGMAFAYFVVFPLIFSFFVATTPDGVAMMTDISKYLDFVLALFFAFGMAFEIPVATVLLVAAGMVSPEQLASKRPYVIVGAFVIGMFLTPPDVFSQTLLAVPMWLLFEAGIFFSRLILSQPKTQQKPSGPAGSDPTPASHSPQVAALAAPGAQGLGPTSPQHPGKGPWSPPGEGLGDQLAGQVLVGAEIDGGDMSTPGRFVPMTPEQMDAELDAIEGVENRLAQAQLQHSGQPPGHPPGHPQVESGADRPGQDEGPDSEDLDHADHPDALPGHGPDGGEVKLRRVQALREAGDLAAARGLLYEVLEEGDADQRMVARNILAQLDTP